MQPTNPPTTPFHAPPAAELNQLFQLFNAGRFAEVENCARLLAERYPDAGLVWNILGASLQIQRKDGLAALQRAAELMPHDPITHSNVGNALREQGRPEEALACYRRALAIKADLPEAHYNLGNALQALGRFAEAAQSYRQAIQIRPHYAEAFNNLGTALKNIGQFEASYDSYRQALALNPNQAETYSNLSNVLRELGQSEAAAASARQAIAIRPDYAEAYNNLATAMEDLGKLDEAIAGYKRTLDIKPDLINARSNLLFVSNYSANQTPANALEQARQYGQIVSQNIGSARFSSWPYVPHPQRLRVGLVSGDLFKHPVGFFLEGVLAHIDPAHIELIAYSSNSKEDELTQRIRPYFSAWKNLCHLSDEAAANLIHADGVHVLIDLSGHTKLNRLPVFAWKPAPVQASWLGYFATTGIAEIDYVLADKVSVPEQDRDQFIEGIWYLPETRLCFSAPDETIPVAPLPALAKGAITFGCFQNLSKVGDEVLAAWSQIFTALPNARLRMQCKQFDAPTQKDRMLQRLSSAGIAASRVMLHGSTPRASYLAAHAEVDMILDTFPYSGGTTTCEALWMGVPTLTLEGKTMIARQGAALLKAAGLVEWIAYCKQDYIDKAILFANDVHALAQLRSTLRQQAGASPLFDATRFARNLENALWEMYRRHKQSNIKT
ncbi:MAG: tetratricopeptide repeat protein [Burkholderiales bacterium]|nr:tetratricopeptide repeat protein [Burkholderiales bacterium]